MPHVTRFSFALGLIVLATAANAQGAVDVRAGAKAFSSDCTSCHKSPAGLAKNTGASGLVSFLRQHYTTSAQRRGEIAAFIIASGGESGTAQLRRTRDNRVAPEIADSAGQGQENRGGDEARNNRRAGSETRQGRAGANQRQARGQPGEEPQVAGRQSGDVASEDLRQQPRRRTALQEERDKRRAAREAARQRQQGAPAPGGKQDEQAGSPRQEQSVIETKRQDPAPDRPDEKQANLPRRDERQEETSQTILSTGVKQGERTMGVNAGVRSSLVLGRQNSAPSRAKEGSDAGGSPAQ